MQCIISKPCPKHMVNRSHSYSAWETVKGSFHFASHTLDPIEGPLKGTQSHCVTDYTDRHGSCAAATKIVDAQGQRRRKPGRTIWRCTDWYSLSDCGSIRAAIPLQHLCAHANLKQNSKQGWVAFHLYMCAVKQLSGT